MEDAFSGAYRTTGVPPAWTSAGPPTATLNGAITNVVGSCTINALPAGVARARVCMIEAELCWYIVNAAGTGLSIYRGINGTTNAAHADATKVTFVETFKTRIYSTRSTICNKVIYAVANGGRGFLSHENSNLPLPPITIRDAKIDAVGGDLMLGQHVYWQGWQPDIVIEGMTIVQDSLTHAASDAAQGSAIHWDWLAGSVMQVNNVPMPAPRIYGRNNDVCVHGVIGTTNNYAALRGNRGWALLDFDLAAEVVTTGSSNGSGENIVNMNPTGSKMVSAPGSRLAVKARMPNLNSDGAPVGLRIASSTWLVFVNKLDVDFDAYDLTFSGSTNDTTYAPWTVDSTQVDKVRFGKVRHDPSTPSCIATGPPNGSPSDALQQVRHIVVLRTIGDHTVITGIDDHPVAGRAHRRPAKYVVRHRDQGPPKPCRCTGRERGEVGVVAMVTSAVRSAS